MCVCVCMHIYVSVLDAFVHVCVCTCANAHVCVCRGQRSTSSVFLSHSPPYFCVRVSPQIWRSLIWPDLLTSEPQRSHLSPSPSSKLTSVHCHASFFFMWVFGTQAQGTGLHTSRQANSPISRLPSSFTKGFHERRRETRERGCNSSTIEIASEEKEETEPGCGSLGDGGPRHRSPLLLDCM